jgi:uncharacterized protein
LPESWRKKAFVYEFKGRPGIKNTIQAIGVPHGEVDLILVNGESVDFDYQLQGGEEISVYPQFESIDISPVIKLTSKTFARNPFCSGCKSGKTGSKASVAWF